MLIYNLFGPWEPCILTKNQLLSMMIVVWLRPEGPRIQVEFGSKVHNIKE